MTQGWRTDLKTRLRTRLVNPLENTVSDESELVAGKGREHLRQANHEKRITIHIENFTSFAGESSVVLVCSVTH